MKYKVFLFALSIVIPLSLCAGNRISPQEGGVMVQKLYDLLKKTVDGKKAPIEYKGEYGYEKNGQPQSHYICHKNDFYLMGMFEFGEPIVKASLYYDNIVDCAKKNDVSITCELEKSWGVGPRVNTTTNYNYNEYRYCYKKTWVINGETYVIHDTVAVNLTDGFILKIYTDIENKDKGDKETPPLDKSLENNLVTNEASEWEMIADASTYYDQGRYLEAASLYSKITQKYPANGLAWYSLGVMYFKGQGVGNLSKKQRLKKAYDCWKKSDLKDACRAIAYITDGREGC